MFCIFNIIPYEIKYKEILGAIFLFVYSFFAIDYFFKLGFDDTNGFLIYVVPVSIAIVQSFILSNLMLLIKFNYIKLVIQNFSKIKIILRLIILSLFLFVNWYLLITSSFGLSMTQLKPIILITILMTFNLYTYGTNVIKLKK